jgi:acetone carboxylase gamma subunit
MHYYKDANNFSKLLAVLQDAVIEATDIAEANWQL